jgi:L,D-peptidoglycan transpeptidase YkuD (ErfK/YbiS/YcfS/YnhG family)
MASAASSEALVYPARLLLGASVFRAALGRAGVRGLKEEGDGATPAGLLPLRRVLYRADRTAIPRTALPREPIAETDGWCDDPGHRDYNRLVTLPHPARCEELWRRDGLYDIVAVLGWNDAPVERGRGSAIFLHIARPGYAPTEGCVALSEPDLRAVLAAGVTALRVLAP